jgi:hypothetical protein
MPNPRLLETVAAELRRQGFHTAEIVRFLQELEDHVEDLCTDQGGSMDEQRPVQEWIETRLGRPEVLVAAARANRRPTSVFGRHPILSCVVAPIPLAILFWIGFLFFSFAALSLVSVVVGEDSMSRAVRDWPAALLLAYHGLEMSIRFLPPAAATVLLCWCAYRGGLSWRWTLTASGLVALIAGAFVVQSTLPVEAGQGNMAIGLGFPVRQWINLIQLLVPLAVGAVFLWRTRHRTVVKA